MSQYNNLHSVLLSRTACPECSKLGKDKSRDNLALYSDGHFHCFSCGYHGGDNVISKIRSPKLVPARELNLPNDVTIDYPAHAVNWCAGYEITQKQMRDNGILWSDNGIRFKETQAKDLLLFPVWNKDELLFYQGRNFSQDKSIPKWIGRGKSDRVFHFLFNGKPDSKLRNTVVFTEDIISAIKVSLTGCTAMPLFGNNFKNRIDSLLKLTRKDHKLLLWLDPNMTIHSTKECSISRLRGLQVYSIHSLYDPKEHSLREIENYVTQV